MSKRKSNLELLRIISMILIVMSHCDEIFGLSNLYSQTLGIGKIINDWLNMGGQIGVGCFLLISGYFMIEQRVTLKKIMRIGGQVWFYTISIWLGWLLMSLYLHQFDLKDSLVKAVYSFFPILFSHYWFVTAYIILMILAPFFNKLIYALNEKEYKRLLVLLIGIFVVIGGGFPKLLEGIFEGRIIPVFVVYFVAGYIKRFVNVSLKNSGKHLMVALGFYVLLFASSYIITYIGILLDSDTIKGLRYFYRELNSPLIIVICVELFLSFLKMDIGKKEIINSIAGKTFGVYLIHSNKIISSIVLPKIFPIYLVDNPVLIFIYSVESVIIIYVVCTAIDSLRQLTVEKLWLKILNSKLDKIQSKISVLTERICCNCKKVLKNYYCK